MSSCAVHSGLTSNANLHSTEVVLSKKNFKVIENVKGSATARYILGFGGLKREALIAEAKAKMLSKVNFAGTSRAVINETVEVKFSVLPFVRKYQVTVSAQVIEFTE